MQWNRPELRSSKAGPEEWRNRVITGEQLGICEKFPDWLESSYLTLREQVLDDAYPCFFGTQAERRGEMFYAFVHGKDTAPLAVTMRTFAELAKQPAYDKNNLAVFFEPDASPLSHQVYQDLFWRTLQELHEADRHPHADRQPDPSDTAWEFCYAGVEMFVVCACPSFQKRRSRNLGPGMVLLFQPRSVFVDKITNQVIGRRAREQVRHRLSRWDELGAHPDLGFYGEPGNLEWKQYFLPDENTPHGSACPFLRRQLLAEQDVVETASREHGDYPLTAEQRALWLAWQMEPGGAAYNVSASMRLDGEIDVHACRHAWKALVQRHAVLRSRFHEVDGELRQSIDSGSPGPLDWAIYDLRGREDTAQALRERLHWRASQPFDLASGVPARATLIRLDASCSILQLASHHIVADGWSVALLRREWMECYASAVEGRPPRLASPPISFGAYAKQKQIATDPAKLQQQQAYWRRRLQGVPPLLTLPLDRPRAPRRCSEAGRTALELSADLCDKLQKRAAECGVTPFVWMLAVFGRWLRQESGQSDLCIAVPLSRRQQRVERRLVGYLVNTVAIRLQMDQAGSWADLIGQAGARLQEAEQHADCTFMELLQFLGLPRDPSFTPLCQVLFNQLRRLPDEHSDHLKMRAHQEDIGRAQYDLCLHVAFDRQAGQLFLDYASALFDASTAQRLLASYHRLLEQLAADPQALAAPLPRLAGTEEEVLGWWQAERGRADEPARLRDSLNVAAPQAPPVWQCWRQAVAAVPMPSSELARQALLHGAWGLWLARSGYRRQAVFGSLEAEGGQALPLWLDVPCSLRVGDWLDGIQRQLLALHAHRPASSSVWKAWMDTHEDACFDSVLDPAGLWSPERTGSPLPALVLSAEDPTTLRWHWDEGRMAQAMVRSLAAEFADLLAALAHADRSRLLATLPVSKADPVIVGEVQAAESYSFVSVLERLAEVTRRRPQAEAVIDTRQRLDYAGLERWSGHIAARLAAQGVSAESRVGVYMPRSCGLIAALLGVLRTGAAYVPLDPAHPAERLLEIAADAGLCAIVAQDLPESMRRGLDPSCWLVSAEDEEGEQPRFISRPVHPEQLAYVIYTSGSTGKPKGVAVSHGNVARLFDATAAYYHCDEHDVWALFHAYAFDVSVWEWLGALTHGGRLVVVPVAVARDAQAFHRLLRAERITVLNQTPSAFMPLMEVDLAADERFSEVRLIIFAGEKLEPGALLPWYAARAQSGAALPRIVNMYGITETTVHATCHVVSEAELKQPMPPSLIGAPIEDLRLYLLDPTGAPTPAGGCGELWVAGPGVVRGYLGRPGLTAQRFLPDPYGPPGGRMYASGDLARRLVDSGLAYLGRCDLQVKIRGYRVEPGELQAALYSHPQVRQAVALAVPGAAGQGMQLAAYVTPSQLDVAALREDLARRLPAYLLPAAIVALDALPLTVNGKLDRQALPPAVPSLQTTAPRTATEQALALVWAEVLGIDTPSAEADFFALGGHSLLALRVMSRLRERVGREAPLELLFSHPRLDRLASALDTLWAAAQPAAQPALLRLGEREAPLSFAQERLWVLWKLDPQSSAYHVAGTLQCEGELDAAAMRAAFQALVQRHEVLRSRFVERDGVPWQRIVPATDAAATFDWRHEGVLSPAAAKTRLQALARQVFDLEHDALLRVTLVELAPDRHWLQVVMHHIVSDGWSIEILLRELAAGYRAARRGMPPHLPELPIQYADYARWQRQLYVPGQPGYQAQLDYWRTYLDGLEDGLELPSEQDRHRPYDRQGAVVRVEVPAHLLARTQQAASEQGATLFMWLLAVFDLLLYRYSGHADVAVAVPWAGRDRRETEDLIGFFVNTLILRTSLSGAQSFTELLAKVRADSIQAQAHRAFPFDRLVAELNPPRRAWDHPYAQVKFLLQDEFDLGQDLGGLDCRLLEAEPGEVRFQLALDITRRQDGLDCSFSYAADLYEASFMQMLACHYVELLAQVINQPQQPVGALTLSEQVTQDQAAASAALGS